MVYIVMAFATESAAILVGARISSDLFDCWPDSILMQSVGGKGGGEVILEDVGNSGLQKWEAFL